MECVENKVWDADIGEHHTCCDGAGHVGGRIFCREARENVGMVALNNLQGIEYTLFPWIVSASVQSRYFPVACGIKLSMAFIFP